MLIIDIMHSPNIYETNIFTVLICTIGHGQHVPSLNLWMQAWQSNLQSQIVQSCRSSVKRTLSILTMDIQRRRVLCLIPLLLLVVLITLSCILKLDCGDEDTQSTPTTPMQCSQGETLLHDKYNLYQWYHGLNIIQIQCEEYFIEYCQPYKTLLWIWIML